LRKRQEIPSGHDARLRHHAHHATSHDGAQVPSRILHRKDLKARRQSAAAALRLRLLWHGDAGLVQRQPAVAGRPRLRLRNRTYPRRRRQGWGWYLDGKREKKTNSFHDFAAAGAR